MAKTSACTSCGAPIYWLKHEKTGKLAPIDVTPNLTGNCLVNVAEGTYRLARGQGGTCPQAATHRPK
jgi:hypothetical protein